MPFIHCCPLVAKAVGILNVDVPGDVGGERRRCALK